MMGFAQISAGGRAFLEEPPGGAYKPVVLVKLQLRQGFVAKAGEVDRHGFRCSVYDLVNPPVFAVGVIGVVFVALSGVVPVGHVDRPVGPVLQLQPAKPTVVGLEKVGLMPGDVARAPSLQPVAVDALPVDITCENIIVIAPGQLSPR